MQGFRSAGGLQRFTSVFSAVRNLFVPPSSKPPPHGHGTLESRDWHACLISKRAAFIRASPNNVTAPLIGVFIE